MKKLLYFGLAASALLFASCDGGSDPVTQETPATTFATSYLGFENSDDSADSTKIITIKDSGKGIGTYTMSKNTVYILEGLVFVNDGQTLTVEAGTIIKGRSGQGESASALIVAQGGKIMANGTKAEPIIMTGASDKVKRDVEGTLHAGGNLGKTTSGQWGGLIVLGKAGLNSNPGTTQIEGISTSETRGIYGGSDDADNSGVIKYVSIRHGGTNIGSGNEINGLTLGGVGSATEIDYVEVIANDDDGIEFFGGTARVKHALVVNTGDDSYDYDEGWRGYGQFWVSVNPSDRNGEHDGGTKPETATPYATPTIYNATYIGGKKITFRDNAGGYYNNSIFEGFSTDPAIDVEDLASGDDSKVQFEADRLTIEDNIFSNSGSIMVAYSSDLTTSIADASNEVKDLSLTASSPVPASQEASSNAATDAWFSTAAYKGAFDGTNWAADWTLYYGDYGI